MNDNEAFDDYVSYLTDYYFGNNDRKIHDTKVWHAACLHKQKEIDELKSQIYVTGSIHEQGDIKREMTWKESSEMMENFNKGLMKQLGELKIKLRNVQAENANLRECVEFYADLDDEAVGYDVRGVSYARSLLKELDHQLNDTK